MDEIDETTDSPNVNVAREHLETSHTEEIDTHAIIEESRRLVKQVRSVRERNHFAEKIRLIIRGSQGGKSAA